LVSVKNIEILESVNSTTNTILLSTTNEANTSMNEVTSKLSEVEQELIVSQNMLEACQTQELYTQGVLADKTSEHLYSEAELSEAIALGNPMAIASASAEVARTANEVRMAEREYEEAKQSRYKMEERVELINRAYHKCNELLEHLQTIFGSSIDNFDSLYQTLNTRLSNAKSILESYLSQDSRDLSITEQRSVVSEKYQHKLNQYNQGNISKEELNKVYIEKLNHQKENFIESQYAQIENVKISKYGLPEFESKYNVFIQPKEYDKSRANHFRTANNNLKMKIEADENLKEQFTSRQLEQINMTKNPEGYTWHHDGNPPPGRIQLVKTDKHDKVRHDGGYSLWTERR